MAARWRAFPSSAAREVTAKGLKNALQRVVEYWGL